MPFTRYIFHKHNKKSSIIQTTHLQHLTKSLQVGAYTSLKNVPLLHKKKMLQSSCVLLSGLRNKDVAKKLNEMKTWILQIFFFALRYTGLLHRHSSHTASRYLSHSYGVSHSVWMYLYDQNFEEVLTFMLV